MMSSSLPGYVFKTYFFNYYYYYISWNRTVIFLYNCFVCSWWWWWALILHSGSSPPGGAKDTQWAHRDTRALFTFRQICFALRDGDKCTNFFFFAFFVDFSVSTGLFAFKYQIFTPTPNFSDETRIFIIIIYSSCIQIKLQHFAYFHLILFLFLLCEYQLISSSGLICIKQSVHFVSMCFVLNGWLVSGMLSQLVFHQEPASINHRARVCPRALSTPCAVY